MVNSINESVKEYYGKELRSSEDLKTNACCTNFEMPKDVKHAIANIHDEVVSKYYGCGLVIPTELEGLKVLDLGSGSGRDCYILAQFVGENGHIVGVDMTEEQLAVANRHVDYHAKKFGYKKSNVEFKKGRLEDLDQLGLEPNSFDLIISNCVINLVSDKEAVLKKAYDLLKPGGEIYFSDVYSSKRIPQDLVNDEVLYGECLSGALYWNDFLNLAKKVGFADPRSVEADRISIRNKKLEEKIKGIEFYSVTYRLFKIEQLEPDCEEFGQAVRYKGSIKNSPQFFDLDDHHRFEVGKIEKVCGNSYLMLYASRFSKHFEFFGSFDTHYGIYEDCGKSLPFKLINSTSEEGNIASASCC